MKQTIRGALAALLAVPVLLTAGCSTLGGSAGDGSQSPASAETTAKEEWQTITSEGSGFSLSFPLTWTATEELSELATIEMGYPKQDQYLVVIPESKDGFGDEVDLAYFSDLAKQVTQANLEDPIIANEGATTIGDGIAAHQFEISGSASGIKVAYLITLTEDDSYFY